MSAIILPELPSNEFNWLRDVVDNESTPGWTYVVGLESPSGAALLSHERSEDSVDIIVPQNKVRSAVRQILGYAQADTTAPWRLRRPEVPIHHGIYPWLWAMDCSVLPFTPKGNSQFPSTVFSGNNLGIQDSIAYIGYGPRHWPKYSLVKITIRFGQVWWSIIPDNDVNWDNSVPEWQRFVGMPDGNSLKPKAEIVTLDGTEDAQFVFAETDKTTPTGAISPVAGPAGNIFRGSIYVYKTSTSYTIVWKCVPEAYCCEGDFRLPKPTRMINALGRVNSGSIFGNDQHRAGTFLFDALSGKRYQLPVRTNSTGGYYAWDWFLTWTLFDPEQPAIVKNSAGTDIPEETRKRGHLLVPWRGTNSWYYASRGTDSTRGTYSGIGAVEEVDFDDIFLHVDDPT